MQCPKFDRNCGLLKLFREPIAMFVTKWKTWASLNMVRLIHITIGFNIGGFFRKLWEMEQ